MLAGPDLNLLNVILASAPIVLLIAAILIAKWSAPRAGALAWLLVITIGFMQFGGDAETLAIGSAKGLSLSLFVLSIIWTSVLLYNTVDQIGGIHVIGTTITKLVRDPLAQALVVGWGFSGFMQGIAGFGVPVAVVAPLMVLMGFRPVQAAAIVLVGHAWAVSFGSLGSSYYTIQLVTGIEAAQIGPHMAMLFALPIVATGFAVAHLEGGMASVRRGMPAILLVGVLMSCTMWSTAILGAPQIASIATGLVGCTVGWAISKTPILPVKKDPTKIQQVNHNSPPKLGFHLAFLPYYLLIGLNILSQIPAIKELGVQWNWGLDYPATETGSGFQVAAQDNYAKIQLLRHPAPLILISLAITYVTYRIRGVWKNGTGLKSSKQTYSQCVSTSVGVGTMVMMALVMTDTGMTTLLGQTIANSTGIFFPIFSPFIGVLGTFMTGSNTNSNVMFGALQLETAKALDISQITVASTQSIGGAIGSSIAPAKVLVGTTIVGLSGRVNEVMRRTIFYCIGIVFIVGIQAWVVTKFLDGG